MGSPTVFQALSAFIVGILVDWALSRSRGLVDGPPLCTTMSVVDTLPEAHGTRTEGESDLELTEFSMLSSKEKQEATPPTTTSRPEDELRGLGRAAKRVAKSAEPDTSSIEHGIKHSNIVCTLPSTAAHLETQEPGISDGTILQNVNDNQSVANGVVAVTPAERPAKQICIRIAGFPEGCGEEDVLRVLMSFDSADVDKIAELSLYRACASSHQVALVIYEEPCTLAQKIGCSKEGRLLVRIEIEKQDSDIELTTHFLGLTPLNKVPGQIVADIVAITGLAGHAFGSWRSRVSQKMWLKDFLPSTVPGMRIMTYGYNSTLIGNTVTDRMIEYRKNFIHALMNARLRKPERPVIFIAHSMGGILLLQALLECKNGGQYEKLLNATRGIFFFGTPHDGMEIDALLCMIQKSPGASKASRLELVEQLKQSSYFLDHQRQELISFWDSSPEINVVSFFEKSKTATVAKTATGSWARNGTEMRLVKPNSAQLFLAREHTVPVPTDHTNMVKFDYDFDETYQSFARYLCSWEKTLREQQERHLLLQQLYPHSTDDRHKQIQKARLEGTGNWLLEDERFQRWKAGETNPILWAHGIPGAGKTFLASLVIDELNEMGQENPDVAVAFCYFNYKQQAEQAPACVLSSIIKQLASHPRSLTGSISNFPALLQKEVKGRDREELVILLQDICQQLSTKYILFDAMDECDRYSQRAELLPLCHTLAAAGFRLLITSRQFADDIDSSFASVPFINVYAQDADIKRYTLSRMEASPKAKRLLEGLSPKTREDILGRIVDSSAGMFLFISLNVKHLAEQPTVGNLRREIDKLNHRNGSMNRLNVTYDRIVDTIHKQNSACQEIARRALCFVLNARRLLLVTELAVAIAIVPGTRELDEDFVPHASVIIDVCGGLITVDRENGTVRLAHYTAQQYLLGEKTFLPVDQEAVIAHTCITYLSFDKFGSGPCDCTESVALQERENMPFIPYVANYLFSHVLSCSDATIVEILVQYLTLGKYYTDSWLQLLYSLSPGTPDLMGLSWPARRPTYPQDFEPIHCAALLGHLSVFLRIAEADPERSVYNSASTITGATPLHISAAYGHLELTQMLARQNYPDPNIEMIGGITPLFLAAWNNRHAVVQYFLELSTVNPSRAGIRQIVDSGNERDSSAWFQVSITPLYGAVLQENHEIVALLLDRCDTDPNSMVHYAQLGSKDDAATLESSFTQRELVWYNSDDPSSPINTEDSDSPLVAACARAAISGKVDIMELLLARPDVWLNVSVNSFETPLHAACRGQGRFSPACERLIRCMGLDLNQPNAANGETPMMVAIQAEFEYGASNSAQDRNFSFFERGDTSINIIDQRGRTVLHVALECENGELAMDLLSSTQIVVNSCDSDGRTPLHHALHFHLYSVVRELLSHPQLRNTENDSLYVAVMRLEVDRVRILLQQDPIPDLNVTDSRGRSLLSYLVTRPQAGALKMLELFLEHAEVDCNVQDPEGLTPLATAVTCGSRKAVLLLLSRHDIDVNLQDERGLTPLNRIVTYNAAKQLPLPRLLLLLAEPGINPSIPDFSGQTPLDNARLLGHHAMVRLLDDDQQNRAQAYEAQPMSQTAGQIKSKDDGTESLVTEYKVPDGPQFSPLPEWLRQLEDLASVLYNRDELEIESTPSSLPGCGCGDCCADDPIMHEPTDDAHGSPVASHSESEWLPIYESSFCIASTKSDPGRHPVQSESPEILPDPGRETEGRELAARSSTSRRSLEILEDNYHGYPVHAWLQSEATNVFNHDPPPDSPALVGTQSKNHDPDTSDETEKRERTEEEKDEHIEHAGILKCLPGAGSPSEDQIRLQDSGTELCSATLDEIAENVQASTDCSPAIVSLKTLPSVGTPEDMDTSCEKGAISG